MVPNKTGPLTVHVEVDVTDPVDFSISIQFNFIYRAQYHNRVVSKGFTRRVQHNTNTTFKSSFGGPKESMSCHPPSLDPPSRQGKTPKNPVGKGETSGRTTVKERSTPMDGQAVDETRTDGDQSVVVEWSLDGCGGGSGCCHGG